MTGVVRQAVMTFVALTLCVLVGIGGLIFAELVPDIWVVEALERAEGRGEITAEERPLDNAGIQIDEASECTTLSVGLGEIEGQSIFTTTALAPNLGPCWRLLGNLNPYDGATAAENRDTYLRYWHGSAPIVRPVLATVGLSGLRVVGMLAIAIAGAAVFGVVRRSSGTAAAGGLVAPVVLTTSILSLPGSIHQALAFAAGLAGAALAGTIAAGGLTRSRVWYPSLLAGAAFVYIDLLTAVPGQWLLVAALVGLAALQRGHSWIETAGWMVLSGVGWLVGYAGIWLGKWVYAGLILSPRLVYDDDRAGGRAHRRGRVGSATSARDGAPGCGRGRRARPVHLVRDRLESQPDPRLVHLSLDSDGDRRGADGVAGDATSGAQLVGFGTGVDVNSPISSSSGTGRPNR